MALRGRGSPERGSALRLVRVEFVKDSQVFPVGHAERIGRGSEGRERGSSASGHSEGSSDSPGSPASCGAAMEREPAAMAMSKTNALPNIARMLETAARIVSG